MIRFFPYPTLAEPLPMSAETQSVDGAAPEVDMLAVRRSVDLSGLTPGWRRVTVRLRVELPGSLLGADVKDVTLTLSVDCRHTNLRFGIPMKPGARLGTYVGDVEIEPGTMAHRATLRAVASATVGGVPHRYLGSSDTWNIWVDAPTSPVLAGDLEVRWAHFSGEDCPEGIDPAFRAHTHYIDVTADPPVIWLNESVAELRRLFDDAPRRPAVEKAVREAHFHAIASAGWLAMFNSSLGGIEADDEGGVTWPDATWQQQVLQTVLPRVYPDLSIDDALARAYEDDLDHAGSRLLQARAMAAIDGVLHGARKVSQAITALEAAR